jgi:NTE family protein
MRSRPDVLVLGGGGVLGEAWMMGVLAGIEDATGFDLRRCEYFVGTSAGSIVAAHLAAGSAPRRPSETAAEIDVPTPEPGGALTVAVLEAARRAGGWALTAGSPLAPLALGLTAPGGALMRAAVLRRLPPPRDTLDDLRAHIEDSGARFDGRLRITAVDRRSGRRVVFGRPGAPAATVGQAVQASCAVPWLYAPVQIAGREYVDGGVWSPTNLDVAPAGRDTHVLCLNPTAGISGSHVLLELARNFARSAASLESLALRRRGTAVQLVAPSPESATSMGSNVMRREPRRRVLAAGHKQGLKLAAER